MRKLTMFVLALMVLPVLGLMAAGQQVATTAEPMEISWFGLYGAEIQDGNEVQQHLEEMFDVTLVNKQIDYKDREKINLMIASGEHTDYTYAFVNMVDFFTKGAFRSIPRDMIREHAPGYTAWLDASGPVAWHLGLVPGSEDEYMGLVRALDYKIGTTYEPFFRLDYLEAVGVEVPGLIPVGARHCEGACFWTKEAFTADQVEEILYLFRDGDPSGGVHDVIPLGISNESNAFGLYYILALHGLNGVDNYDDGGKTVKQAVHSQFREALKTAQRWFQDGLMDSELPAVNRKPTMYDKIIAGIYGTYTFAYGNIGLSGDPSRDHEIPQSIIARYPDARVVVTPPTIAYDGKQYAPAGVAAFPIDANGISAVHVGVSDEKLAKILQIYDYVNFDGNGMLYTQYGTEGVNFEWDGEAGNSYPTAIEGQRGFGGQWGFGYYNANTRHKELYSRYQIPVLNKELEQYFKLGPGADWAVPQFRQDVLGETDYIELSAKLRGALNTLRDEFTWEAVTTDLDIDAAWDAYVERWLSAGGQELLDELAKMPQVLPLREGKFVY
ncbi:MAG: hypothetical protein OXJ90_09620 [Spirochaetaceae bacterium]|nr:hypothetical protein [Spirochaetaceae bacterium]